MGTCSNTNMQLRNHNTLFEVHEAQNDSECLKAHLSYFQSSYTNILKVFNQNAAQYK